VGELLMSDVSQVRAAVARSRVAWACGDHDDGQSQDSYSSGVPPRARAGLTELSDRMTCFVIWEVHMPQTSAQIAPRQLLHHALQDDSK
jgi:hypothetical protein